MASVVSLIAKIGADSTEFHREMQKVSRTGETFEQRFGARLGVNLSRVLAGAAATLLGTIVLGIRKLVKSWDDAIDKVDEYEARMKRLGGTSTISEANREAITAYQREKGIAKQIKEEPGEGVGLWSGIKGAWHVIMNSIWRVANLPWWNDLNKKMVEQEQALLPGEGMGLTWEEQQKRDAWAQKRAEERKTAEEKIAEYRASASLAAMTDEEKILELTRKKLALEAKLEGMHNARYMEPFERDLSETARALLQLKKARKPAELTGYALIGAGDLSAIGGFAPGSDAASMLAISEQQLNELRQINRNTSNRATFQLI